MTIASGPKGTRDFYPEEMAFQQFIFSSWKKTCEKYGFEQIEAPMFEHLEIYTQKSGEEIEKQLYTFKDKGNRLLALRPELTPSLARMVASKGTSIKKPIRWYSIPRLFRYEKMQKGRLREFFQLNMDILGISEITADAELIAAVINMMTDLGFTSTDFKVRISSRTLLDQLFIHTGLKENQFAELYSLLDKKNKISKHDYLAELEKIIPEANLRSKVEDIFNAESLHYIENKFGSLPAIKELQELFKLLDYYTFSEYAVFDIGIVRGLAYYTGIVFEVFDIKKSLRAIAGGGRYDKLVGLYGGPSTPAVGFAAGDVVLGELMKDKNMYPGMPSRSTVFLVALADIDHSNLITTAQKIRSSGISCEFSLKNVSVGKQLKNANAARSIFTIFIGGQEETQGKVRVKNMLKGTELLINKDSLVLELHKMI